MKVQNEKKRETYTETLTKLCQPCLKKYRSLLKKNRAVLVQGKEIWNSANVQLKGSIESTFLTNVYDTRCIVQMRQNKKKVFQEGSESEFYASFKKKTVCQSKN